MYDMAVNIVAKSDFWQEADGEWSARWRVFLQGNTRYSGERNCDFRRGVTGTARVLTDIPLPQPRPIRRLFSSPPSRGLFHLANSRHYPEFYKLRRTED